MKISKLILIILIISVFAGGITIGRYYNTEQSVAIMHARAVIYPTKGNTVSGTINFVEEKNGLHITAHLTGLTPGKHGFHVHEFGMCNCDDAVCAGDHYNPTHDKHGGPDDVHRHVGDFGNIIADEQGVGTYDRVDTHATLHGVYSLIGRTVIIHAQEDDYVTQPTGNAGSRIGCGVIGIAQR